MRVQNYGTIPQARRGWVTWATHNVLAVRPTLAGNDKPIVWIHHNKGGAPSFSFQVGHCLPNLVGCNIPDTIERLCMGNQAFNLSFATFTYQQLLLQLLTQANTQNLADLV